MKHIESEIYPSMEILLQNMNDAFVSLDKSWCYRYVNTKALSLMRRKKEDLIGKIIWKVFPEIVGTIFEEQYRRVMTEKIPASFDAYYAFAQMWLEIHVYPHENGILIFYSDITEKKKAQGIIKESEKWFRNIADGSPIMIWSAGIDRRCNYFNYTWLKFRGRSLKQELGRGWHRGIFNEDKERILKIYIEAFNKKIPFRADFRMKHHDGSYRWVSYAGKPLFAPDNNFVGFAGTCMDINEQVEVYNELENRISERTIELTKALEREKELNDRKSKFVSMASHEFRTPLSTIHSSIGLMERYYAMGQPDHVMRHMERIKSSANHMINILNDFLSLDRLEQGTVELENENFNLEHFIRDNIIEELTPILKFQQEIVCQYRGGSDVNTDKKVVHNLLINLLSNAIKYSDKDVVLNVLVTDMNIHISVMDRGIGIPKKDQKFLFKKYFRASNVGNVKGTGLGLNIVERYIELLEGTISFTSIVKKGTTFNVNIPYTKRELPKSKKNIAHLSLLFVFLLAEMFENIIPDIPFYQLIPTFFLNGI